jgi:hypothetical protein
MLEAEASSSKLNEQPLHMNSRGNAPGGHSPAIADWLQLLASPKSSGAFPRECPAITGNAPSASLQLSTASTAMEAMSNAGRGSDAGRGRDGGSSRDGGHGSVLGCFST